MRLLARALLTVLLAALPALAQTIPVSGSHVVNSAGVPLASGTLVITPTNLQHQPIAFRVGGGGTGMASQVSIPVTNGSFATTLPDILLTNPINVCFKFSVQDPVTFTEDLPGYACVQPSTQPTSAAVKSGWCNATSCNLDLYVPTQLPGVPVTSGPQGLRGVKGNPGCLLGSTCNNISFNGIPGVVAAIGDGVTDDSTAIENSCNANADVWMTAPYAFASSATLNCNLHFIDNGELIPASGVSIVLNGTVDSGPRQIFGGLGAIVFGPRVINPLAEWFGAVADGTLAGGGTDNTVALQKGINALTTSNLILSPFIYKTSGSLIINKSGIGLSGKTTGYSLPQFGSPAISTIVSNSPTADVLDVVGTAAQRVYWGHIEHLALGRSVLPTGTVAGLSMSFTCGMPVRDVVSSDSTYDFYMHSASSCGQGELANLTATWVGSGLTYGNQTLYGFYFDSSDGASEGTLYGRSIGVVGAGGSTTTIGAEFIGTALNDVDLDFLSTAGADYGIDINFTGPNPATGLNTNAYDMHFHNATIDESRKTGVRIRNVYASQLGGVSFEDGWVFSEVANTGYDFDIESSSGVTVEGMQLGGPQVINLQAVNSLDLLIAHNQFKYNNYGNSLQFQNTVNSSVNANIFDGAGAGDLIAMTSGSVQNAVTGNMYGGTASYGYYADATSGANVNSGNVTNTAHIGVASFGDTNGACPFTGKPAIAMQPGAGSSPGFVASYTSFLDPTAANNNCAFNVVFKAGSSPAVGVLDPSSSNTPTPIFNAAFQTFNATAFTWPYRPNCTAVPATSAAAAVTPTFIQSNPGLVSLDLGPGATLTAGSVYEWTVRCAIN